MAAFNNKFFPSPEFKKKIYSRQVDEKQYGLQKEKEFLPEFQALAKRHKVKLSVSGKNFLDKWYMNSVRKEISFVNNLLEKVDNIQMKHMLQIILSRTIRSCRATTHSDLATLIQPVYAPYYCTKHKKICKPIFSILKWWKTYSTDTVKRLQEFAALRTPTLQHCFTGNSATLDIPQEIKKFSPALASVYRAQKIRGIFCSPPYIGLIDYHEQHAYAYETFHLPRKDEEEIGSMKKGNSKAAIQKYIQDIARVLKHCKKYLAPGYDVFLVANDKYNIYPQIAEQAGMRIVETFRRPVLNRTEKDKGVYSETIFRLREKSHA